METNKPVIDLAALLEEVNEMIEEKLIIEGEQKWLVHQMKSELL